MASVIDKYVFALMLDAKGFKKGGSEAIDVLGGIKNAFLKTYSLVGGFDLFKNMLHTYTDAAKSIDDFSLITGENTIKLQAWQKAIQDTGGDVKGLQGTIRRIADMQAQLARYGTADGLQEFLRIGIDPRGKTAFQVIEEAGKKLALVKDNAKAFNIAKSIGLDESTFIMLRRYGNDFGKVIKANEKYAYINKQAIRDTREYNRIVSSFKTSWLQLSQSIMKDVLPVLEKDLFPVLKNITDYLISDALPTLKNDIWPVVKEIGKFIKFSAEFYGEKAGEFVGNLERVTYKKSLVTPKNTNEVIQNAAKDIIQKASLGNVLIPSANSPTNFHIGTMKVVANDPKQFMNEMRQFKSSYEKYGAEQLGGIQQ